jgi:hypothetical protein
VAAALAIPVYTGKGLLGHWASALAPRAVPEKSEPLSHLPYSYKQGWRFASLPMSEPSPPFDALLPI